MRYNDGSVSAALHALTLAATARTALGVSRKIADRRAGYDPSEEEADAPVRTYLQAACGRMASLVVQLRLRTVADVPEEAHVALVQDFEVLVTLATLVEELRVAHQKLLSLYPGVDEALVEAIRYRHVEAQGALETEALYGAIAPILERLADDLNALRIVLVERA